MEDWPGGIPAFQKCEGGMHMALFVGIDVSKEKFDACGIGEQGEKVFVVSLRMNKSGFEDLLRRLSYSDTRLLVGMESTACYHNSSLLLSYRKRLSGCYYQATSHQSLCKTLVEENKNRQEGCLYDSPIPHA
jgi:hypothetical protein